MSAPNWTRFVPYSSLILQAAREHRISPEFLAATVGQETGGRFHTYAVTLPERSFGLGQLREKYFSARWRTVPWWDPANNISSCAAILADFAHRGGLDPTPGNTVDWLRLRHAYTHGVAGARARFGDAPTLQQLSAPAAGARALQWAEAILRHPLIHRVWFATTPPVHPDVVAAHPGGRVVTWTYHGLPLTTSEWAASWMQDLLPSIAIRGRREERTWTAQAFATMMATPGPYPGAIGRADWRELGAAKRRLGAIIIKCALILRRWGALAGPLGFTSTYRSAEVDAKKNPRVKVSQHGRGLAADLYLPEHADPSSALSVVGAARLLGGHAFGPDLAELGGLGVYSAHSAAAMIHVDGRARPGNKLFRWAEGYPSLII